MRSPQAEIAAITALAIAIADGKSSKELIYISTMFTQLSNTLRTLAFSMAEIEIISVLEDDDDNDDD